MHNSALVLFSGGQDSTTCLAHALARYERVETLGFDYGQRHHVELTQRQAVLQALRTRFAAWAARLGEDHMLDVLVLGQISDTALTRDAAIAMQADGMPNTFVPGRNLLFLTLAAALAYRRGLQVIVTGVCETDYSGYPDCRDDTMKALQVALSLGMDKRLVIETPLMWIDKAQTWELAYALGQQADAQGDGKSGDQHSDQNDDKSADKSDRQNGGQALVDIIVEHSHTCYLGERSQRHEWGYGCGQCPACELRAQGWRKWRGA